MTITLVPVDADNWWDALELSVFPEQLGFVANYAPIVAFALAKAYVRHNGLDYAPYLIYADGQAVGFVELATTPDADAPCWLYHLFIDKARQGNGYGKQALDAFIRLVQQGHPRCREIRLSVHPDNVAAVRLYTGRGFVPTGELYDNGEQVYALRLG